MALDSETAVTEAENTAPAESGQSSAPAAVDTAAQTQDAPTTEGGSTAEPKSLLDAALTALGQKSEGEAGAAADAAPQAGEDPARPTTTDDQVEPQGEALDGIPLIPEAEFKALPKTTRTAVNLLRKEVRNLRPQAERAGAVDRFMAEAGISAEEFAEGQDVMALMKRNPAEALRRLEGYATNLRRFLGLEIPDDLRQEVEAGYLTEDRARELSQSRARAENAERTAQATTEAVAQNAILAEVAAWENATRQSDPDFDRKLSLVKDKASLAVMRLGRPVASRAEAVDIVRRAYGEVNEMMRSFAPPPAATRPTPTSAASAPAKPAAPKNLYEAAMAGLRGG